MVWYMAGNFHFRAATIDGDRSVAAGASYPLETESYRRLPCLSPHADAFKPQLPTAVVVALPCFASGKGRQIMQYVRAAN
jgi:hypothetical protein